MALSRLAMGKNLNMSRISTIEEKIDKFIAEPNSLSLGNVVEFDRYRIEAIVYLGEEAAMASVHEIEYLEHMYKQAGWTSLYIGANPNRTEQTKTVQWDAVLVWSLTSSSMD